MILHCFAFIWIFLLLLRLSYTDLKTQELENLHIALIIIPACVFSVKMEYRIIGSLFPLIMTPFLGFGDILLYSALGFVFGIDNLIIIMSISAILGGLYALFLLATKKAKAQDSFAFAPNITIAFLLFSVQKICSAGIHVFF